MNNEAEVSKFIVFTIANYLLALPIAAVVKVVSYPPTFNERTLGIVQIGQHTIVLIDLHQKLLTAASPQSAKTSPFLVVIQVFSAELCGIPVDEPPDLVELPKDSIRALPSYYAQAELLELVSHVAVLSQEEKTSNIFLINITKVLNAVTKSTTPRLMAAMEHLSELPLSSEFSKTAE